MNEKENNNKHCKKNLNDFVRKSQKDVRRKRLTTKDKRKKRKQLKTKKRKTNCVRKKT